MGLNVLVVIDVQNDFVSGALGSEAAQEKIESISKKVKGFDGEVVFTKDTHGKKYLQTLEGKHLPIEHCMNGTWGWELAGDLEDQVREKGWKVFEKPTFGSVELAEYLVELNKITPIESVELLGFCTDICVISNALLIKANLPEVEVKVDAELSAGTSPEAHEAALMTMRSCQIDC